MDIDEYALIKEQIRDLKLYGSIVISTYSELQRVPGGYVHITWNPDSNGEAAFTSCFIPISEVIKDAMIYED